MSTARNQATSGSSHQRRFDRIWTMSGWIFAGLPCQPSLTFLHVEFGTGFLPPAWRAAKLPFPIHAHNAAASRLLAARGVDIRTLQAFMGHRSIANTVVYTAVADKADS
jgi:integrase